MDDLDLGPQAAAGGTFFGQTVFNANDPPPSAIEVASGGGGVAPSGATATTTIESTTITATPLFDPGDLWWVAVAGVLIWMFL